MKCEQCGNIASIWPGDRCPKCNEQGYLYQGDSPRHRLHGILEARIAELENKLNKDSQNFELECRKAQLETAEARIAELEAVLREIAEMRGTPGRWSSASRSVLRAKAVVAPKAAEADEVLEGK